MTLQDLLTWGAIGMFSISALLWWASTHVKVSAAKVEAEYQKIHGPLSGPAQIVGDDGSDFTATVQLQSRWSRRAAVATAVALVLQALATAFNSN
ncbi:hypothetical protein J2Y54_000524 [Sphingomonas sp. BE123]|uniref:hypothetical protein n=1 Tax=Sphingomonas sp. BE123 TaxID=2817842 RepID=UPI0028556DB9|nr:hypothetical protein [Sphingomonas sp. BE123]MDR6851031.1 hypothetical protein [Sphingomonas sp. BE123]